MPLTETQRGKRRHKLLPKDIEAKLPELGSTDGEANDAIVYLKLFSSFGRYTLYVTEYDGEDTVFGYCLSALGPDCDEFGYASLRELEQTTVLGDVPAVERDCYFDPVPLRECEGVG